MNEFQHADSRAQCPEIKCSLNRDEHRVGLKIEFWSIGLEFGVDEVT